MPLLLTKLLSKCHKVLPSGLEKRNEEVPPTVILSALNLSISASSTTANSACNNNALATSVWTSGVLISPSEIKSPRIYALCSSVSKANTCFLPSGVAMLNRSASIDIWLEIDPSFTLTIPDILPSSSTSRTIFSSIFSIGSLTQSGITISSSTVVVASKGSLLAPSPITS